MKYRWFVPHLVPIWSLLLKLQAVNKVGPFFGPPRISLVLKDGLLNVVLFHAQLDTTWIVWLQIGPTENENAKKQKI